MIKYSIIIPTCNKNLTQRCLEYISRLNRPEDEFEVLVVHNVSEENIQETVDKFQDKIPNLRYIYEKNYGQMPSRHRGAREAHGENLCFLDDDSFVDKNWLIAIEKIFKEKNAVLAGGNNIPLYEISPPEWLRYFWNDTPYGKCMTELSLIWFNEKEMKLPAWFAFGCNFIIKKDIFFKYGGTNPDVVPKDKQRFQGDGETVLSLKLNKAGYVLHFDSEIRIYHFITKDRMSVEYFKKRAFYQGVCDSFSKIRSDHGFDYYRMDPNSNIDKLKFDIIRRVYNRIINIGLNRTVFNINKNYKISVQIKKDYAISYNEGFIFHQSEVKKDSELLKWVLQDTYL
jgi:cellulose synthase/poly-beta-1,6-N-acetylglucosamine synthase-like glycosyltransferase